MLEDILLHNGVFGRNFTDLKRLHMVRIFLVGLAWLAFQRCNCNFKCLEIEQRFRELTLHDKINMAFNTKMLSPVRYDPGDLVFYKRYQPPADRNERSHQELDVPRRRVARWYGPARILAMETKVSYYGHICQPHHVA